MHPHILFTHTHTHTHTHTLQSPGSTSTTVMTRSSSTKKSGNKFRYSWHVTDLDDVIPNGGTPNSEVGIQMYMFMYILYMCMYGGILLDCRGRTGISLAPLRLIFPSLEFLKYHIAGKFGEH